MLNGDQQYRNTGLTSLYCINNFTRESEEEMIMVLGSLALLLKENSRAIL
jgi:hypothetical protein